MRLSCLALLALAVVANAQGPGCPPGCKVVWIDQAVTCQNWLREPMADQLEFDCGGYTDGTSGGPFLSQVDPWTGQGQVIGVIGGYEQGGNTPQVSYSTVLGSNAAALYKTAVAGG